MNSFISKNWTFKRELIDDFIYSLNVYVGVQLFAADLQKRKVLTFICLLEKLEIGKRSSCC